MIADLHSHYPMHLLAEQPRDETLERMVRVRARPRWVDKLRAATLASLARVLNFRRFSDTWRVDLDKLEKGDVRVVLSVLYQPFAEMDLEESYGSKPEPGYFQALVDQLDATEKRLLEVDPERKRHEIVRSGADLPAVVDSGRVGFLHCVEGGFHLGDSPEAVREHVAELARRGVFYVTLAHLFWRQVATNAPALPFLPDPVYRVLFHQPRRAGLTELGIAAVKAMYDARMLIDISHMRRDAIDATFALLDELDRRSRRSPKEYPVMASHAGFRCGRQQYLLGPETVKRIAARDGVIGLILAQHQLNDGIRRSNTKRRDQSLDVIYRHIDAIGACTGSLEHVALGSDLDGFIKPTMAGFETAADLRHLEEPLRERYGDDAELILNGNALRVLTRAL